MYLCQKLRVKLEDELKHSKPFRSELEKLILNISVTSNWFNAALSERLKPFDLSPQQYNVLRILKGRHPESYCNQEITCRMIDKSSNATRIVDKLVEKELASRMENKNDRRHVNISITDKGIELLQKVSCSPISATMNLGSFNEEKARLMNEWLDELRG